MFVGTIEIHPVEFGRFRLDGGAMFGVVPKTLWQKEAPADEENRIDMALRGMLIRLPSRNILVDTGIGEKNKEKFRQTYCVDFSRFSLSASLRKLGLQAEDITDVIITHLHFDHTGGATRLNGEGRIVPTFPKAVYRVQREQYEWALHPCERDRVSFLPNNFVPLQEQGCLELLEGEKEIAPGVIVLPMHGHTPAQQIVKVSQGGETLLFAGDLIPMAAHIPLPWIMSYDLQPLVTLEEKKKLLPVAVSERWTLLYEHDPVIVASQVEQDERGFHKGSAIRL